MQMQDSCVVQEGETVTQALPIARRKMVRFGLIVVGCLDG
jgi:hypothetical protein